MSARILSGIYGIRNTVNGRVYVGATAHVHRRWRAHRRYLNKGVHHCRPLQNAWVKHGGMAFVFEIIEAVEREEGIDLREQVHLDAAFATGRCYNTCLTAGSTRGYKHTDAAKASISAASLGHTYNLGRKHPKEAYATRSVPMLGNTYALGYKHSDIALAKISAAGMGRKASPETLAKMRARKRPDVSERSRGVPRSAVTKARISAGNKGKVHSAAQNAAFSMAMKGRPLSVNHREKLTRLSPLTAQDVLDIRQALGSNRSIARQYRVSHETVNRIRNRKSWTHLPG